MPSLRSGWWGLRPHTPAFRVELGIDARASARAVFLLMRLDRCPTTLSPWLAVHAHPSPLRCRATITATSDSASLPTGGWTENLCAESRQCDHGVCRSETGGTHSQVRRLAPTAALRGRLNRLPRTGRKVRPVFRLLHRHRAIAGPARRWSTVHHPRLPKSSAEMRARFAARPPAATPQGVLHFVPTLRVRRLFPLRFS